MPADRPEYWSVDVGPADVALLEVPPALRPRTFQVDVRCVVRCPSDGRRASHALTVELDGRRAWTREIPTSNPGQTDSLDYQRRVEVDDGAGLRIRAVAKANAAQPLQLRIEAQEQEG
jgi:hypothetical protein